MTHIKALAERWLNDAHQAEMAAIAYDPGSKQELDLKLMASTFRLRACELEVAILEDEYDANPVIAQTPSRS